MNESINTGASYLAPRHAHLPFDCSGAAVRAQCRHLATVVTITGAVDATNVDQVSEYKEGSRLLILGPLVRDRKGEHQQLLVTARRGGFARVRVDGS